MFDTVAIEPQGRIQDSMLGGGGGGGAIFKSCERRRREAMLGRGGRYELGTLSHTENSSNLYSGS